MSDREDPNRFKSYVADERETAQLNKRADADRRIKQAVEIGMAYLLFTGEDHKQFAIEAMLSLLTGCSDAPELRARFNCQQQWKPGEPI